MGDRLLARADVEFDAQVNGIVNAIARDPARFGVERDEAESLRATVARFREALRAVNCDGTDTSSARRLKNALRAELEPRVRRLLRRIDATDTVDAQARYLVGLSDGPARATPATLPDRPPRLRFVRGMFGGNGEPPVHELAVERKGVGRGVWMNLYVELVPPHKPVPPCPGAFGGVPCHVAGFTLSRFKVHPPICRVPMLVVYYGRWALANQPAGPYSAPAVARIEGWAAGVWEPWRFASNAPGPLPAPAPPVDNTLTDEDYHVAVREAQLAYLHGPSLVPRALPAPRADDARQLPGPSDDASDDAAREAA